MVVFFPHTLRYSSTHHGSFMLHFPLQAASPVRWQDQLFITTVCEAAATQTTSLCVRLLYYTDLTEAFIQSNLQASQFSVVIGPTEFALVGQRDLKSTGSDPITEYYRDQLQSAEKKN